MRLLHQDGSGCEDRLEVGLGCVAGERTEIDDRTLMLFDEAIEELPFALGER